MCLRAQVLIYEKKNVLKAFFGWNQIVSYGILTMPCESEFLELKINEASYIIWGKRYLMLFYLLDAIKLGVLKF